ncbi:MAG: hypothetical protein R3B45_17870 [Bdellovibrionota bacterium]
MAENNITSLHDYFDLAIAKLCESDFSTDDFMLFSMHLSEEDLTELYLMCGELESDSILQEIELTTTMDNNANLDKTQLIPIRNNLQKKAIAAAKLRELIQNYKKYSDHAIRGGIHFVEKELARSDEGDDDKTSNLDFLKNAKKQ